MSADKIALLRRYDELLKTYDELVATHGACTCDQDALTCMAHGHAGPLLEDAAQLLILDVGTCQ